MSSVDTENMIVGLDIGTSKVVAIVGKRKLDGSIEVVGIGSHASRGLKRGVVVNIETTVQAIQRAVEEAVIMAQGTLLARDVVNERADVATPLYFQTQAEQLAAQLRQFVFFDFLIATFCHVAVWVVCV